VTAKVPVTSRRRAAVTQLVSYLRVSSAQQGRSGLGLEEQREALARFAAAEGLEIGREFLEVETGKGADALKRRPQLKAALAEARKRKCVPSPTTCIVPGRKPLFGV
jgi:DNA invertase Pin-like site-specific DNA recombinase